MKKYTQLTEGERNQLYAFSKEGLSKTAIARRLGRDPSTISREMSRNCGQRGYRPQQAHGKAVKRREEASSGSRTSSKALEYIMGGLKEQWSPEQISGRMMSDINEKVSHEKIYQMVYEDRKAGGELYKNLRHGRKRRKKRCNPSEPRAGRGCIKNRVDIDSRPKHVENRKQFGHWEIDTIIGKGHSGAAVTIVERKTRFAIIIPLANRKAENVAEEIIKVFLPIRDTIKSITADNGKEFALHEIVSKSLNIEFYFAKPYHSWERGTNENTNGLIRQYIPKSAAITDVSRADSEAIMHKLNNRPRRTLGFNTPTERFLKYSPILPKL